MGLRLRNAKRTGVLPSNLTVSCFVSFTVGDESGKPGVTRDTARNTSGQNNVFSTIFVPDTKLFLFFVFRTYRGRSESFVRTGL